MTWFFTGVLLAGAAAMLWACSVALYRSLGS
ncbi:hypothetical protein BKA01_005346 [Pseudonocardia eucalypti]|nr:hypothetical protein [Pseudonocardia eucalypti]